MDLPHLVRRSLVHYWRTNLAVILGVATAVSVLSGALLVGHSVRGSLADLVRQRLGSTDLALVSPQFFREQLAADLSADSRFAATFRAAVPLVVASAVVTEQESGRRAGKVRVYGVDDRFWRFHGLSPVALGTREAALSPALAREVGARPGAAVLVRVERPSDIPLESLHSRKDETGRTLRLTTRTVIDAASLGEFSLDPSQGDVLAVFVPLARLRDELEVGDRVNTILVSTVQQRDDADDVLRAVLKDVVRPEDVGFTLRAADDGRSVIVGSVAGLLEDRQVESIRKVTSGNAATGVFTYLANTLRVGDREIPYSLVSGIDLPELTAAPGDVRGLPPVVLNTWAFQELAAQPGQRLSMEFYVWEDPGRLATRRAEFEIVGTAPVEAHGPDLAPEYPGISNTDSLADWDPPFPLDLRRVRPADEAYWDRYRATPKAFIPLADARRLWASRYGSATSVRIPVAATDLSAVSVVAAELTRSIDPAAFGLVPRDVRSEGLQASRGATDFGEYFLYFSFFIVISALVLVVLFFKLGVEQRIREIGLLRTIGLAPATIRRLFLAEGVVLATIGSLLGVAGAVAYAAALIRLLTTRWVDAVGTTALTLHVSVPWLASGAAGGVVVAVACIWWTLRGLRRVSERSLLAGDLSPLSLEHGPSRAVRMIASGLLLAGVALAVAAGREVIPAAVGFFGAGAILLVAVLMFVSAALRRPPRATPGRGWSLYWFAARNVTCRPGRTVLSMAVIAAATFILVSVDAFRRDAGDATSDRAGGTGGYQLMVQTLLPVVVDPNAADGRETLNIAALDSATRLEPFRVRPGDDASCLNLYQPTNPRIVAPRDSFLTEGRFTFASSTAQTEAERANPWMLLNRDEPDGAIPVIADANSMTYVLHRAVGEEFALPVVGGPVRLKFVAALSDSIFQSELVMSERNFRRLFPDQAGSRMLLVETTASAGEVSREIEAGLSDAGADAVETSAYLASFHRVENTYLSTFQTLGGLGLLLGTVGLATVLLRNAIERRRELAMLAAVGYRRSHFLIMALVENFVIVVGGLLAGAACAAVAIAPAVADRGGRVPLSSGALLLLFAVFVVAMLSSLAAVAGVTKSPLLEALRSE